MTATTHCGEKCRFPKISTTSKKIVDYSKRRKLASKPWHAAKVSTLWMVCIFSTRWIFDAMGVHFCRQQNCFCAKTYFFSSANVRVASNRSNRSIGAVAPRSYLTVSRTIPAQDALIQKQKHMNGSEDLKDQEGKYMTSSKTDFKIWGFNSSRVMSTFLKRIVWF